MRPIHKELTSNRTFTEQFKTRRVDTECNKIIFLFSTLTNVSLLWQSARSLLLPRRCNVPKLEAADAHYPSFFPHSMQRTQRNGTDWVRIGPRLIDPGRQHGGWRRIEAQNEKESFSGLPLCLFWINPHTARVLLLRIVLASGISSRGSHSFKPAFGNIYCCTALLIYTLNWSKGRLIYVSALCRLLTTTPADWTPPQMNIWTATQI